MTTIDLNLVTDFLAQWREQRAPMPLAEETPQRFMVWLAERLVARESMLASVGAVVAAMSRGVPVPPDTLTRIVLRLEHALGRPL